MSVTGWSRKRVTSARTSLRFWRPQHRLEMHDLRLCARRRCRVPLALYVGEGAGIAQRSYKHRKDVMVRIPRRTFLKLSGGAAASVGGGLAAILATGRAPAYAQQTTIHWLRWNDFVPASDQLLRKELLPEAEKALGIKVNFETVNGNDLQPRITSAIQSGSGPDVFMLFNNHPQIYSESLVDLSDLTDAIGKAQGGYYDLCKANS